MRPCKTCSGTGMVLLPREAKRLRGIRLVAQGICCDCEHAAISPRSRSRCEGCLAARRDSEGPGPIAEPVVGTRSGRPVLLGPRDKPCGVCDGTGLLMTRAEQSAKRSREALAKGLCRKCFTREIALRSKSRCDECLLLAKIDQANRDGRS